MNLSSRRASSTLTLSFTVLLLASTGITRRRRRVSHSLTSKSITSTYTRFKVSFFLVICFFIFWMLKGSYGSTFTFANRCGYTVWPGILSNAGSPTLSTTGFELPKGTSRSLQAPTGWSGRFWARTGCKFDSSGSGTCKTGDCGSNAVECAGLGAAPPVTLAEFTLGTGGDDFYDVSLVDGYNVPMLVAPQGGSGLNCSSTGCVVDLNGSCPSELKVTSLDGRGKQSMGCKSACEAFRTPEYCCSGAHGTPDTCKPSSYSLMFKTACPRAYSYAYDDQSSTFTCAESPNYVITFCPTPNTRWLFHLYPFITINTPCLWG